MSERFTTTFHLIQNPLISEGFFVFRMHFHVAASIRIQGVSSNPAGCCAQDFPDRGSSSPAKAVSSRATQAQTMDFLNLPMICGFVSRRIHLRCALPSPILLQIGTLRGSNPRLGNSLSELLTESPSFLMRRHQKCT